MKTRNHTTPPHRTFRLTLSLLFFAVFAILTTGLHAAEPETTSKPIPFSEIGAKATADYKGDALGITATAHGATLRTGFQKLAGAVTREGLRLDSTADEGGGLQLSAISIGRGSVHSRLDIIGTVAVADKLVTFSRPALTEEYSVSADGVRQDFIVATRPAGTGDLHVELALSGATAEAAADGARLTLDGSARVLAYSRLHVTDAAGRELVAKLEVLSAGRLAVLVEDASATFPVRIDPTFSDADWVSLNPGMPGANGSVLATVVDGSSNLYIGGSFSFVGTVAANRIAKWNGSTWSVLGTGVDSDVSALAVSGPDLYVGGFFTTAGGVAANRIAKWNGSIWSALGSGMNSGVRALAVSGTDLYVGGFFTTAGNVAANRIAKWNGSAWLALGIGMDDTVRALSVSGTDLYAGGFFTTAGGVANTTNIAKWNGSVWSALGTGVNNPVFALAVSGPNLYAGGDFSTAGGVMANRIAKWNGNAWSALGTGMNSQVNALAASGTDLYAVGNFNLAGGVSANFMAKWNGSIWSALGSGMNSVVYSLAVSGADLFAVGGFSAAGGVTANSIAKWNGGTWSALGTGMNGQVTALTVSGTDLYAGGEFTTAGGATANHVAKWNGSAWSALGTGMNSTVRALAVSGTSLYAGGFFTTAGGTTANCIAKWNGSAWSALGSGMNGAVFSLAVSGMDLYVGGLFNLAGGVAVSNIAKWNGSAWSALKTGVNAHVYALAVNGADLYAGGFFTTADGATANRIAKWNGSAWSALGSGMNDAVVSLAVRGPNLYAGGDFGTAGGVTANGIAMWNGSAWLALGSGMNNSVYALAVSGADLYAGGFFTTAGGATANRIAKWNGSAWSALGSGMNNYVLALAPDTSGHMFIGGSFTHAGTRLSPFIAQANLDVSTEAPTLSTPATNAVTKGPVSVAFILPEAALPGSVKLSFGSAHLTLASSQETAGSHSFSFNPASPLTSAQIASGGVVAEGTYTVMLSYRDALGNAAASATSTNVRIDTTAPSLALPANITAEATTSTGAAVTYTASADDTGGSGVASSGFLPASGSTFPLGTTTVNASATDNAGNTSNGSFTVTVMDTIAPIVDAHANVTVPAASPAGAVVAYAAGSATDVVGVTSLTYSQASGTVFPIGSTTVTVTATDAASNSGLGSFTVTVTNNGPVVTLAGANPMTFEAAASYSDPGATAGDVEDGPLTPMITSNTVVFNVLGAYALTWSVTDSVNATGSATRVVNVVDTTAPVVASHANVTVSATSAAGAVVTYALGSATDAVVVASLTYSQNSGTMFPIGTTTVTITAKDAANNTGMGTFTVTVTNNAPVVTLIGANALTFEAAASYTDPGATAGDVEDGPLTPMITSNTVVSNVSGAYAVTWSATDSANATGSATRVVNVVDTTAPVVAAHADVAVEATSAAGAVLTYAGSATDAVGVTSLTYTKNSGTTFPIGTTTVTITAEDAATNAGTGTFTVTVEDTIAPVVATHANVTVEATSAAGAVATYAAGSATDVVGVTSLTYSQLSGTTFPIGTTIVTITANDAAHNTGTGIFTVMVTNNAPMVTLTGPNPLTFEAAASYSDPGATAGDVEDGPITPAISINTVVANVPSAYAVTWSVTDSAGVLGSATRVVNVVDSTSPVVAFHANVTVPATSATGAVVTYAVGSASDVVGVTSLAYSQDSGTVFPIGTTTVTITAKDGANNTSTGTFTVTVTNNAPVVTLTGPNPLTSEASATYSDPGATAGDVEDGTLTPVISGNTVVANVPGVYAVTWSVTDSAGASGSATRLVRVVDTTAPAVALHANVTVEATSAAGAVVAFDAAIATDAVGVTSLSYSQESGTMFPLGNTTVIITAKDAATNTGSGSFAVTVRDTTAPVVALHANVTVEATSAAGAVVTYAAGSAADVVGVTSLTYSQLSGTTFPIGTTTLTITAKDAATNIGTGTFTVTVRDTTAPVVASHVDVTVEATSAAGAVVTYAAGTATDAVGVTSLTYSQLSGTTFPIGTTTVTITAKDAASNTGTGTFTVTVRDTTPPVVASHVDVTAEATSAAGAVVTYAAGTATDAVGIVSLTYSRNSGTTFPIGITTVTITAKDRATNTGTGTFKVTVADTTAPVVAAHANMTVEATSAAGAMVAYAAGSATDAVGVTGLTYSQNSGTTFPLGTTIVTITAKDAAANSGTGSFTVTVEDTTPPVISQVTSAGPYPIGTSAVVSATFSDLVGVDSITFNWDDGSPNTGMNRPVSPATVTHSYAAAGVYQPTVTVRDGSGNSVSRTVQYLVIYDTGAGFVTGGGWFNSPAGAYAPNAALTGKANFGFNAKYKKGTTAPTGELQFDVGSLKFNSTNSEWLVVSGAKVQYKGSGTINGAGSYGFLLTATDGKMAGGGGTDRFRIKLCNKNAGNSLVYDNAPGRDDITGSPTQPIAGGSIVIHK